MFDQREPITDSPQCEAARRLPVEHGGCVKRLENSSNLVPHRRNCLSKRIALLWCAFGLSVYAGEEGGVRVLGVLQYTAFKASGLEFASNTLHFECMFTKESPEHWMVRFKPLSPSSWKAVQFLDYYEAGTDGTNCFYLEKWKPEIKASIISLGRVRRGSYPDSEPGYFAGVVWFALVSPQRFLDEASRTPVRPVWPVPHGNGTNGDYRLLCSLERHREFPRLPKDAVFYSSGMYPQQSPEGELLALTKYPPPFDKGFTNAVYVASGFTNAFGLSIPKTFILRQYRPRPNAITSAEIMVAAEWEGQVTDIVGDVARTSYVPIIVDSSQLVTDYRLQTHDGKPLNYVITNKTWASESSTQLRQILDESARGQRSGKKEQDHELGWKKSAVILGLALIVFGGPVILIKTSRKQLVTQD